MRALVTGCAGFVGSHLTESLLSDGVEVVGIDCFNDNYGRSAKLANLAHTREWDGFDFVPVDLARGDLADLVSGCEVVFHLAAEPGVRSSWGSRFELYLRNNVLATQYLLEAATASKVARFVYASSSSVYGEAEAYPTSEDALPRPHSPYGTTKLAAEHLCHLYHRNHGVPTVALRYFTVYGPRQRPDMAFSRFCTAALDGERVTLYGDGRQTRDFTFVSDAVQATRLAATAPVAIGGVYNVGGGSQVQVIEVLRRIEQLAGRAVSVRNLPAQAGDVRHTRADTTRARADLGFAPAVHWEAGIQAQFAWTAGAGVVGA